jgi:hypothetical protein
MEGESPFRRHVAWGLCCAAYLVASPYFERLNNPNENVRFFMTAAIVDDHTFAIDHVRELWGWVNDAAIYGGHAYSVKAPGTSYLGVPAYWLYRTWCNRTGHAFDRTTALWMSRLNCGVPIYALTAQAETRYRCTLFRDVYPLMVKYVGHDREELLIEAENVLVRSGVVKAGDLIVLTIGEPIGKAGGTNTMKIVKVGEHRA